MKICTKCKIKKPLDAFRIDSARNWRVPIEQRRSYYREECKECEKKLSKQLREAKKHATPQPDRCECCNKKDTRLVVDHDHKTGEFRGWLCRSCNLGLGKLGDDITGIQNALNYLNKKWN